jgi:hypothetical protein
MKERIQELMKQAGTDVSGKWMGVDHATKFAELIVQECAEVCYDHSNAAGGVDTDFGYGYKDCGDDIKRHFGVEERAIPILSDDEEALLSGITSSKLFTIEAVKKAFGVKE